MSAVWCSAGAAWRCCCGPDLGRLPRLWQAGTFRQLQCAWDHCRTHRPSTPSPTRPPRPLRCLQTPSCQLVACPRPSGTCCRTTQEAVRTTQRAPPPAPAPRPSPMLWLRGTPTPQPAPSARWAGALGDKSPCLNRMGAMRAAAKTAVLPIAIMKLAGVAAAAAALQAAASGDTAAIAQVGGAAELSVCMVAAAADKTLGQLLRTQTNIFAGTLMPWPMLCRPQLSPAPLETAPPWPRPLPRYSTLCALCLLCTPQLRTQVPAPADTSPHACVPVPPAGHRQRRQRICCGPGALAPTACTARTPTLAELQ